MNNIAVNGKTLKQLVLERSINTVVQDSERSTAIYNPGMDKAASRYAAQVSKNECHKQEYQESGGASTYHLLASSKYLLVIPRPAL